MAGAAVAVTRLARAVTPDSWYRPRFGRIGALVMCAAVVAGSWAVAVSALVSAPGADGSDRVWTYVAAVVFFVCGAVMLGLAVNAYRKRDPGVELALRSA
jgi:TRAP-type C4-dicarboxylate transport system permease small subunit